MAANNKTPAEAANHFGVPANRIRQWKFTANHANDPPPPTSTDKTSSHRIALGPVPQPVAVVRSLLAICRKDMAMAREDRSWQAVNAFARLERQLWADLDEAMKREAANAAEEEATAIASRDSGAVFAGLLDAVRELPEELREQLIAALDRQPHLSVVAG